MTRTKKWLCGLLVAACFATVGLTSALAASGTFNFYVSGTKGGCTGGIVKRYNQKYRVTFNYSSASNRIRINTRLHNSNHATRGQGQVLERTTNYINNSATPRYSYHLNIWREYRWDPSVLVQGNWSPDNN